MLAIPPPTIGGQFFLYHPLHSATHPGVFITGQYRVFALTACFCVSPSPPPYTLPLCSLPAPKKARIFLPPAVAARARHQTSTAPLTHITREKSLSTRSPHSPRPAITVTITL